MGTPIDNTLERKVGIGVITVYSPMALWPEKINSREMCRLDEEECPQCNVVTVEAA